MTAKTTIAVPVSEQQRRRLQHLAFALTERDRAQNRQWTVSDVLADMAGHVEDGILREGRWERDFVSNCYGPETIERAATIIHNDE